nr:MAG TPA: hypothetical protein [Caudoviricetes sp.]DAS64154.1 MAG TPA: hypothetical protein [Caudoviricetes sp.]
MRQATWEKKQNFSSPVPAPRDHSAACGTPPGNRHRTSTARRRRWPACSTRTSQRATCWWAWTIRTMDWRGWRPGLSGRACPWRPRKSGWTLCGRRQSTSCS